MGVKFCWKRVWDFFLVLQKDKWNQPLLFPSHFFSFFFLINTNFLVSYFNPQFKFKLVKAKYSLFSYQTKYIKHNSIVEENMVKLTIVGRVNDGLPMSQGPIYDEDNDNTVYKQHAEFLLREISIDALPSSTTTIVLHHHCFKYVTHL